MSIRDEIVTRVKTEADQKFEVESVWHVPSVDEVPFGPKGLLLETAFLYADLRDSSSITDAHRRGTAAKLYRAFLYAMAKVARRHHGQIRSFDGDRIMVIFEPRKSDDHFVCNNAVETGLEMVYCLYDVLRPGMARYDELDCGIGIDFGKTLVARAGLRGDANNNALIWIGKAPNLAAKLSDIGRQPGNVAISGAVFERLTPGNRYHEEDLLLGLRWKRAMWNSGRLNFAGQQERIYQSGYHRPFE